MRKYFNTIENRTTGKVVANAQIRIMESATGAEFPIYSDYLATELIEQPLLTDEAGYFEFFISEAAVVDIQISYDGAVQKTIEDYAFGESTSAVLGVSPPATDLGIFTGTTIGAGKNVKQALQLLETALEAGVENGFSTRTALASAGDSASNYDGAFLSETGRRGKFVFSSANLASAVSSDPQQAVYVPKAGDPTGAGGAWVRVSDGLVDPRWAGAAGDGSTDDEDELEAAIAIAGKNRLIGPKGPFVVTSGFQNPLGAEFDNIQIKAGSALYNPPAHRQYVWGQERLFGLFAKVIAKSSIKMLFSGDSTTLGTPYVDAGYTMDQLILNAALYDGFRNITVVNSGHGGKDTSEWVSTYLAADITEAADVYVVRWGINDPYNSRTISDYATSLRAGLASLRATHSLSSGKSIILMAPNSTSDTPFGRDEFWYEEVVKVCRRAAADYGCAFIDTYNLFQDSRNAAGLWMDDPFGDGRAIHPLNGFNVMIASVLYDLMFPTMSRIYFNRPVDVAPTLLNGWANFGSVKDAGYHRDKTGRVHLSGVIKDGTTAVDTTLFTLPVGFRPAAQEYFPVLANAAAAGLYVATNGDVKIWFGASATSLTLSGVSFQASL